MATGFSICVWQTLESSVLMQVQLLSYRRLTYYHNGEGRTVSTREEALRGKDVHPKPRPNLKAFVFSAHIRHQRKRMSNGTLASLHMDRFIHSSSDDVLDRTLGHQSSHVFVAKLLSHLRPLWSVSSPIITRLCSEQAPLLHQLRWLGFDT
jgi:hypothetical protein